VRGILEEEMRTQAIYIFQKIAQHNFRLLNWTIPIVTKPFIIKK